jgi:hypothetical protein
MIGRIEETSASFEARSAPRSYPTPITRIAQLIADLKRTNLQLWRIEDDIRDHERNASFGESFVTLARSVYSTNDKRSAIKRRINDLLKSMIVEEKSYSSFRHNHRGPLPVGLARTELSPPWPAARGWLRVRRCLLQRRLRRPVRPDDARREKAKCRRLPQGSRRLLGNVGVCGDEHVILGLWRFKA